MTFLFYSIVAQLFYAQQACEPSSSWKLNFHFLSQLNTTKFYTRLWTFQTNKETNQTQKEFTTI